MSNVLLTGFGDWAGSCANPAGLVAEALEGETLGGAAVSKIIAPSVFAEMVPCVTDEIDRVAPDIVIMMGEYPGRSMITVERIAQNLIDAPRYDMGDEADDRPQGPIEPDGPVGYYATVPIRAMVKAMRGAGVPADISDTAGTFGCNLLMYGVLHHIEQNNLPIRAGWIHLPSLPETAALVENIGIPSMALQTQIEGLRAAVIAAVENETDITDISPSRLQI